MQLTDSKYNFKTFILVILCVFFGWLQACSLTSVWDGQAYGCLQILAIVCLILILQQCNSSKTAFLIGWAFATSWLASTFYWLFISLHYYGELNSALAILAVFFLATALALYYASICFIYKFFKTNSIFLNAVLFACLWTLAELARGFFFTGFPWGAIGYSHIDNHWLAVFAPWIGVYGIGFIAVFVATIIALFIFNLINYIKNPKHYGRISLHALIALICLTLVSVLSFLAQQYNLKQQNTQPNNTAISVTLLQGNVPAEIKFNRITISESMRWYQKQTLASATALTIMPETAIAVPQFAIPQRYLQNFTDHLAKNNQAIILGLPYSPSYDLYSNSIFAFTPSQSNFTESFRYDKQHLVPFGEYVPNHFRWFTNLLQIPYSDLYSDSNFGRLNFNWLGQSFAMTICFEDLFGEEMAKYFKSSLELPQIFINTSNITWFGNTSIIRQHLNISRMRAIEFHRPMLRASNSGPTAIINAKGEVTKMLPNYEEGVLVSEVTGNSIITPYAYWVSRYNLYPMWAILLFLSIVILIINKRH